MYAGEKAKQGLSDSADKGEAAVRDCRGRITAIIIIIKNNNSNNNNSNNNKEQLVQRKSSNRRRVASDLQEQQCQSPKLDSVVKNACGADPQIAELVERLACRNSRPRTWTSQWLK